MKSPGWACAASVSWVACVSTAVTSSSLFDQVDDGEDHDPNDVDEVPVQTGDLDGLGLFGRQLAAHRHGPQRDQHHDAERDVNAMEARHHEEARTEEVRMDGEAFVDERR